MSQLAAVLLGLGIFEKKITISQHLGRIELKPTVIS